ncbi:MAG: DUF4349 domain-containing protein [Deltaproteobacteria bacterium]
MNNAPVVHAVLALICIAGCGGASESPPGTYSAPSPANQAEFAAIAAAQTISEEQPPNGAAQAGEAPAAPEPGKLQRQIIYDADVRLIVEDFEGLPEKMQQLVNESGGFVAQQKLEGKSGSPRSGEWKIRIPVTGYASFLDAVRTLGELQSLAAKSQDVSEQYYDLKARIRNKQKEEARLLKHLDENTGKLEDILAVEKEISRVREELERVEGRMRVLKDLVALTTVTLHVDEIKGYIPPQAPTFALRVSRAFEGSWNALLAAGEGLVVAGAAIGPWLVAVGVPAFVVVLFVRRRRRVA